MDVVEWPLLENQREQVGITVHFMDQGVDMRDILRRTYVSTASIETIKGLRHRFEPNICQHLVETCVDFLNG
jgi:folate-dependent phosphoribosylglycinamide formyltransferase PurN